MSREIEHWKRGIESWKKIDWMKLLKPDYRKIILTVILTALGLATASYWNYTSCLNRLRLVESMGYHIGHCRFTLNSFETSFISDVQFPPDFPYTFEINPSLVIEKIILLILSMYFLSALSIYYIDLYRHGKLKIKIT